MPLQTLVCDYDDEESGLQNTIEECKSQVVHILSKVRPNCRLALLRESWEEDDMRDSFKDQDKALQMIENGLSEAKMEMEKNSQVV